MRIKNNADFADAGCGTRLSDASEALDIFTRLSRASTEDALHQAMLAVALHYTSARRACIATAHAGSYRIAACAPASDDDSADDAMLAAIAHDTGNCIAIALPGARAYLCVLLADSPCLDLLTLIATCGATLLENMALKTQVDTHLALARRLNDQPGLLRTLIDNMPDHIYVKDTEGRFILGNAAAASCIGVAAAEDLIGKSDLELFPGACGQRFFDDEQTLMRSGEAIVDQLEENINQAGVRRWYSTTKVPFRDAQGAMIGLVGISRDVTLRVAADEAIGLRNRAIEASLDAIVITSVLKPGNPVVYVNPAFERITGFGFDEATAGGIEFLLGQEEAQVLLDAMQEQREGRAVLHSRRKDATQFWNDVRVAPVRDISGRATHFVFTMTDITKARDSEEQLERMASHDALTGLPNRRMLMDRLGQALALAERGNFMVAVAFIDLDRLKFVNDSFGHEAGDLLLCSVAERMAAYVRKSDTVARLGGDEFVLVSLHNTTHAASQVYPHIGDMLHKIQAILGEPFEMAGQPFGVTCSIGVSIFPQHGFDADSLLKNADAAMYQAKKNGRNQIAFYADAVLGGGGPSSNGL
ncbi:MAG: diguanylate cyclase [Pseudomonadota bacterium]